MVNAKPSHLNAAGKLNIDHAAHFVSGIHLVAFGTADADADYARLAHAGFSPLAPIALQREVGAESGAGTARFTVVRVPPGVMGERLGVTAPTAPWIAGSVLETGDFAATDRALRDAGANMRALADGCMLVELPPELGGIMIVQRKGGREIQNLVFTMYFYATYDAVVARFCLGGAFGRVYMSGGNIAGCAVTGRIAGANAARLPARDCLA